MIEKKDNHFNLYCIFVSIILISLIIFRAKNSGITYDEAYTYDTYIYNLNFFETIKTFFSEKNLANNHILNTVFIKIIDCIFSIKFNELLIRLPNILFGIIYFIFVYKISMLYKSKYVAFSVLLFNYELNEYFGMARGYGIASTLVMIGIYFYKKWNNNNDQQSLLILSVLFLLLSCYANTVCLLIFATVLIDCFIKMIKNKQIFNFVRKNVFLIILLLVGTIAIVFYHFSISKIGMPLYGMKNHFFESVIISLFLSYGFSKLFTYIAIALFVVYFVINIKGILKNRLWYLPMIYCILLIFLTLLTHQMWITGRCLIPVMPLFMVSFLEMVDKEKNKLSNVILIVIVVITFLINLNLYEVKFWENDYIIKNKAYEAINKKNNKIIAKYKNNECSRFYRNKLIYYYNYDIYK